MSTVIEHIETQFGKPVPCSHCGHAEHLESCTGPTLHPSLGRGICGCVWNIHFEMDDQHLVSQFLADAHGERR